MVVVSTVSTFYITLIIHCNLHLSWYFHNSVLLLFRCGGILITSLEGIQHQTRFSTYNNSINEPSLTLPVETPITMIDNSEIKADP